MRLKVLCISALVLATVPAIETPAISAPYVMSLKDMRDDCSADIAVAVADESQKQGRDTLAKDWKEAIRECSVLRRIDLTPNHGGLPAQCGKSLGPIFDFARFRVTMPLGATSALMDSHNAEFDYVVAHEGDCYQK